MMTLFPGSISRGVPAFGFVPRWRKRSQGCPVLLRLNDLSMTSLIAIRSIEGSVRRADLALVNDPFQHVQRDKVSYTLGTSHNQPLQSRTTLLERGSVLDPLSSSSEIRETLLKCRSCNLMVTVTGPLLPTDLEGSQLLWSSSSIRKPATYP